MEKVSERALNSGAVLENQAGNFSLKSPRNRKGVLSRVQRELGHAWRLRVNETRWRLRGRKDFSLSRNDINDWVKIPSRAEILHVITALECF